MIKMINKSCQKMISKRDIRKNQYDIKLHFKSQNALLFIQMYKLIFESDDIIIDE